MCMFHVWRYSDGNHPVTNRDRRLMETKTYCRVHALWQCGITRKHTSALKTWNDTKVFSVIFASTVVKLSARNNMRIGRTLFI